jgi:hypothetical protein
VQGAQVVRQPPAKVDGSAVLIDERDITSGGEIVALAEVERLTDDVANDLADGVAVVFAVVDVVAVVFAAAVFVVVVADRESVFRPLAGQLDLGPML